MKVYITKYAITSGLVEREVLDEDEKYYTVSEDRLLNGRYCYSKKDAFASREDAAKDVLKRIERHRKSITKQLAKLDKLGESMNNILNRGEKEVD